MGGSLNNEHPLLCHLVKEAVQSMLIHSALVSFGGKCVFGVPRECVLACTTMLCVCIGVCSARLESLKRGGKGEKTGLRGSLFVVSLVLCMGERGSSDSVGGG